MSADKPTRGSKSQSRSDFRRLQRRFMSGLLRSLFFINSSTRHSRAGFVLPTTVLLLLVMTLTVGALSFRSFSRTQSVSMAREQQVIDNIAAPAVDRAKAKLEYLFTRDTRLPGTGTPPSDVLATLMLNEDSTGSGKLGITKLSRDPYTLPDEKRLNINGNAINTNINNISAGVVDNAWSFGFDLNGDGTIQQGETIAYSVLMDDAVDAAGTPNNRADDIKIEDTGAAANRNKANNLVTRNGPVDTAASLANCGGSREPQQGWLAVNAATLEKNFQITVFVSNDKGMGRANSALEFQQVRRALQGNRWGAWFKYDMEIHPGPDFNWNGAIHTDGNMLVTNNLQAHMISSHRSCLYGQQGSAITMAQYDYDSDGVININNRDFQGQLIAGAPSYGDLSGRGTPRLHIFTNLTTKPKIDDNDTKLTSNNDSVQGNSYSDLLLIALDPVELFTKNVSRHRGTGWQRATNWTNNAYAKGGRVINQTLAAPYLDDFFRADNRYGPRPSYDKTNWVTKTDDGTVNTTRSSPSYDKRTGDEILLADESGDNLINTAAGLDGYWERQAIGKGMRVVVGQRLELGNPLGWNFNAGGGSKDPLYPPDLNNMANKQKQRVTLRDNLAAVQGMVVYQYESNNGNFPLACIANTAHPGTLQTLINSRTFEKYERTGDLKTDFMNGQGTNGWEFDFPLDFDTELEFGAELANNKPLGIALRNLAYFAGDPKGGSPSFIPVQEPDVVHPFPHQSMWGDYSVLRRIFDDELDNNVGWRSSANPPSLTSMSDRYGAPGALSPADKSSLHSAACTLGLLAYNLKSVEAEYAQVTASLIGASGLNNLSSYLVKLMDGVVSTGSPEIGINAATNNLCVGAAGQPGCPPTVYDPNYYAQFTVEQWLNALQNSGLVVGNATQQATTIQRARLIAHKHQIERDRKLGFLPTTAINYPYSGTITPFAGRTFQVGCDPTTLTGFPFTDLSEDRQLALASALCPVTSGAKYPSLYYLFPVTEHDQTGSGAQPTGEEYINQAYLTDPFTGVNRSARATYKVVGDGSSTTLGIGTIAFSPIMNTNSWPLPKGSPTGSISTALNPETMNIRITDGKLLPLSLLEKVTYNGREEMAVRVLDIDLGRLTKTRTGGSSSDYWISDGQDTSSGIFYAAREDAVREDAVVRPASVVAGATTTWSDCNTLTKLIGSNSNDTTRRCWMRPTRTVATGGPTDPPLSRRDDGSSTGISVKPIDFAPDPDRRPHGFRLNANLDSNNGDLSNANGRTWGFTFVTDNIAYIKGQFNPHTSNGTNTLEEFKETLFNGNVGFGTPFYDNRINLNTDIFSTKTGDRWRVAEVLADAVYIVSNNFVDGAVQEGFIRNRNQVSTDFKNIANSNSKTSFHNQQRPLDNNHNAWGGTTSWLRVDGSYSNTAVPIWVGHNGESRLSNGTVFDNANDDNKFELPDERHQDDLIDPPATERINATIIAGLIPSRNQQSYGGLHNFPRFLEDWSNRNLFIQGAFLQLNFSTAGTGPFDIDAWQPDETPISAERINYYRPPNRRWGYDVGLQYSPAGPIAQRFVQVDRPRSEHYRELSIEDPYVANLRCSKLSTGTRQFPSESCP